MNISVRVLVVLICAALTQFAAADTKPSMIRVEIRLISPEIPAGSFGAKPRVYYIAGPTYSRVEEQPDLEQHLHQLAVVAEPDIWMINLMSHTAQHVVDPGPSFVGHHPILDPEAPTEYASFEFGKETAFFHDHHATRVKPKSIDGTQCEASAVEIRGYRAVLFLRSDTHVPFHIDVSKDGKPQYSLRYLSYKTGLAFDPSLFKPPAGLTITEARPGKDK